MAHTYRQIIAHTTSSGNPISQASVVVSPGDTVLCLTLKVAGATNRAGNAPTIGPYTFVNRGGVQKAAASPEASAELWDVLNPAPGTYTLTIPNTGALSISYGLDAGQAAAGWATDFDAVAATNNTGTNPSPGALERSRSGNITFCIIATGAQTWAPSAQVGTNINNTDDGAHGTGRQYSIGGPGSHTLSYTFGTSDDYGIIASSYKEVPATNFPNYPKFKVGNNLIVGAA